MLVVSLRKDKNGRLHVLNRLEERAGRGLESWFFSLLAEINCYLPDDWRMTKSTNNFRIQINTPTIELALVGYSYKREKGNGIISIVDTVIFKDDIDSKEISHLPKLKNKRIDMQHKAKHPELLQPNLYFFQPCPDDSHSPLFARQYERIGFNKKNELLDTQYHRIHPLFRTGLDLEHYKWVKWDIYGNIEFVDYPNENFHGKDYWGVPLLSKARNRAAENEYIKQYENYITIHSCKDYEHDTVFKTPYEQEYKYLYKGGLRDFNELLKSIKSKLEGEGLVANWSNSVQQNDFYFDDQNFSLYQQGVSFRLRKKNDCARITLKRRLLPLEDINQDKLYLRMEEETTISKKQEQDLFNGLRVNSFPYRLIFYLVPECGAISCRLKLENTRRVGVLTYSGLQKVEICHDIVYYELDNEKYGPFFEIEIESKGAEPTVIDIIAGIMENDTQLEPNMLTKYERGVSLVKGRENANSNDS